MGYGLSAGGHPADLPNIQLYNHDYSKVVQARSLGVSAPDLSRAAAIAAILAVQGGMV